MSEQEKAHAKDADQIEKRLFNMTVGFALAAIIFAPIFYILTFKELEWGGPRDWGTFATYFSGIVTPVVGFSSALLFFQSIRVQRKELEKTREEMSAATKLQAQTERNQYNQNKQKQLERTIPKARQHQLELFERVRNFPNQYPDSVGPYANTGFNIDQHKLKRIVEIEGARGKLLQHLRDYFDKGRHTIKMLNQYLDCGGDIYFHLDIIEALDREHEKLSVFIDAFEFQNESDYISYDELMATFLIHRDDALANY